MSFNQGGVEQAIRELLVALGEDPEREGLRETPARLARAWKELLAGQEQNPDEVLRTVFHTEHDQLVLVQNIPFYSCCEHHLLPFYGVAHVAYLPQNGRVTGLSKLARLVDGYARRLQIQERLTDQIVQALVRELAPRGAACILKAEHLCMSMRGVNKPGSATVTTAFAGQLAEDHQLRQECLSMLDLKG